jgi:hypothetical protein
MSVTDNEFDDPALREAVRRACVRETAPPELRRRIEGMMTAGGLAAAAASPHVSPAAPAAPSASKPAKTPPSRWRISLGESPYKTLAAAAIAIIAVSIAAIQIRNSIGPSKSNVPPAAVTFPAAFAAELVRTHVNFAKYPDHQTIQGATPTTMTAELTKLAGVPVAATELGDGWLFKGASTTTVSGTKAAHLLFARGNDLLSLFSMPAPPSYNQGASYPYHATIDGHPMAGFVHNGAIYCLVGSSPSGDITQKSIDPLLAKVQNSVLADACETGPAGAATKPTVQ